MEQRLIHYTHEHIKGWSAYITTNTFKKTVEFKVSQRNTVLKFLEVPTTQTECTCLFTRKYVGITVCIF